MSDAAHCFLRFVNGAARGVRDFRDAPLAQRVHAIAHDAIFERFLPAGAFELKQQHSRKSRAPTPADQRTEPLEDLGCFFRRQTGRSRHFLNRRLEVAVIVNVADDHSAMPRCSSIKSVSAPDPSTFGEGGSHRERVEHELALFFLLGGLADGMFVAEK